MTLRKKINQSEVKRLILAFCMLFLSIHCKNDAKTDLFSLENFIINKYMPSFYFSRPSLFIEDKKFEARNNIINRIDNAKNSIYIWAYGFDDTELIQALIHAKERNVRISITGSKDADYSELENSGIPVELRIKTGIQHTKVMLIDDAYLISGSGNFTESGFFYNNNVYFILPVSAATAEVLKKRLDYENTAFAPVELPFQGRAGFSPASGRVIQSRIIKKILKAEYSIQYMIFSHTDPVIAHALSLAAKRGVLVEGIYDGKIPDESLASLLSGSSMFNPMIYRERNFNEVETSPGIYHGGHLHHKTMIIDRKIVVTGSYNWSASARDSNMEIYFEFQNPLIADMFEEEFERIRYDAELLSLPLNQYSKGTLVYDETSDSFCANSPVELPGIAVFSGRGLFFRGEYFSKNVNVLNNCFLRSDKSLISAGIPDFNSHYIFPDTKNSSPLNYSYHMKSHRFENPHSHTCDYMLSCKIADIHRASANWIITDINMHYTEYQVWDSSGFHPFMPLTETAPGFYEFLPVAGDAVIFLRNLEGVIHTGCLKSGTELSPAVKYFQNEILWENQNLKCVKME